jgi:DNA-binding NarL/FixJ family response regulator
MSGDGVARKGEATSMKEFRVFIVDDHPIVRSGLKRAIDYTDDLVVAGEAGELSEAIRLFEAASPDLAIVDLALGDDDGLALTHRIVGLWDCPVLIISMHDETLYAEAALRAGARGYVMKDKSFETILDAIRSVLAGNIYLSDEMKSRLFTAISRSGALVSGDGVWALSPKEQEIFRLIGEGCDTARIAARTHLSVNTVETHKARIKKKLGAGDNFSLVRRAVEWLSREHFRARKGAGANDWKTL